MRHKAKVLSFYLPQFHPIPENDKWYGKGFTEWTNVAKAKPLFRGHYQPHVPADLGFYDLRMHETVAAQIDLAKKYGVDGFIYWHYWFGNGKQLLEKPFNNLVKDKSMDFPFALAWANETWEKKMWDSNQKNQIIVLQEYLGVEDHVKHFYAFLEAFKDSRYICVDGKLLFVIYSPNKFQKFDEFKKTWNDLAIKEGLKGFYFVARDFACRDKDKFLAEGYDAIYDDNLLNIHHELSMIQKVRLAFERQFLHRPTCFSYRDAIEHMIIPNDFEETVVPMIAPNWDHSPRSGRKSIIMTDAKPEYFERLLRWAFDSIKDKKPENQILMIRAWNEWGEGNHLEPDLKYGLGYLEAIKKVREDLQI